MSVSVSLCVCLYVSMYVSVPVCVSVCLLVPATIINSDIVDVVEVIENQTLYLLCPAEGSPQPSILWLRDDVPLTFDDLEQLDLASLAGKVRTLSSGRQLELRQVRVEDEAIFQCRATNVAGQQTKRFQLRVLGKLLQCSSSSSCSNMCR